MIVIWRCSYYRTNIDQNECLYRAWHLFITCMACTVCIAPSCVDIKCVALWTSCRYVTSGAGIINCYWTFGYTEQFKRRKAEIILHIYAVFWEYGAFEKALPQYTWTCFGMTMQGSVHGNITYVVCFIFISAYRHWLLYYVVAPKRAVVCILVENQFKLSLHGFGGQAECPWAWWWPSWREWRTSWCPQTDQPSKPR